MTTSTKRQEIATALTASGLVKAEAYKRSDKAGTAWIRLGDSDREPGLFEDEWLIFIVLPQDEAKADMWRDANQDLLTDALRDVLYVRRFTPVNLGSDTDQIFGLQITARSD